MTAMTWSAGFRPVARLVGFGLPLAAALTAVPAAAGHLELAGQDVPVCNSQQNNEWQEAVRQSFGIDVISDPGGHRLGQGRVEKLVDGRYRPVFVPYGLFKETLCGIVGRAERDGVYLIPDLDYAHLLSLAGRAGASKRLDCPCEPLIENCGSGVANCMAAGVTPDETFYDSPWLPENGPSPLAGRKVCTYGAWVADHGHGRRPEIRPAEAFWWRDGGDDGFRMFDVLLVQDDSDRFDRPSRDPWRYFPEPSGDLEPWSKAPRKHRIRYAFEYRPGSPTRKLDVYAHPSGRRFVVTADYPELVADADDGRHHALEIDGEIAVEAEEMGVLHPILGVTFEVCRSYDGSRFQGWVRIRSAIGAGDDGREGYLALRLVDHPAGTASREPSFAASPGRGKVVTEVVERTLKLAGAPWGSELHARLRFRVLLPDREADLSESRIESVQLVAADGRRHPLEFGMADVEDRLRGWIDRVPLISPVTVELETAAGEVSLPGHALAVRFSTEGVYDQPAGPRVWPTMARMLRVEGETPPSEVIGARSVEVQLSAEWAPMRDGEAQPDASSPVAAILARALAEGGDTKLFGSGDPLSVTWTYEARDLNAGQYLPVVEGSSPQPEAVAVEHTPGSPAGEGLRFSFPERSHRHLMEVVATATVTDAFGNRATVKRRVWNHALSADPQRADAWLAALAQQREVSVRLVSESNLEIESQAPGLLEVRGVTARLTRLRLLEVAADGRLDLGEIEDLVRLVDAYGELSTTR
jgi:hypothetical protein